MGVTRFRPFPHGQRPLAYTGAMILPGPCATWAPVRL